VDENLKRLTKKLGQAIDEAINESPKVKDLTEQLRKEGYETLLMVEATICFARRSTTLGGETKIEIPEEFLEAQDSHELDELMNESDMQFLKRLKISIDEDN
jgi:hypothetical protein